MVQVEFGLPDLESRTQIFQIHTRTMNCERDIRYELLARCACFFISLLSLSQCPPSSDAGIVVGGTFLTERVEPFSLSA